MARNGERMRIISRQILGIFSNYQKGMKNENTFRYSTLNKSEMPEMTVMQLGKNPKMQNNFVRYH